MASPDGHSEIDRLLHLASLALQAPMAAIVVGDDEQIRVLGAVGPMTDWLTLVASYRSRQSPQTQLIYNDTTLLAATPSAALKHDQRLRALIDLPLLDTAQQPIGNLYVADAQPRAWQPEQIQIAAALAALAAEVIARHREAERLRHAETVLHKLEGWTRIVAETVEDVIVTIDSDNRILFANHALERRFGYPAAQVIGQPITMLMPDRLRARHTTAMQRYLSTRQRTLPWQAVNTIGQHRDGHEIPIEIAFGEHIEHGRSIFTAIIRDVTDQQHARNALIESQARLQLLNSLALDLSAGLSMKQVVERTAKRIAKAFPAYRVTYTIVDAQWRLLLQHAIDPYSRPPLFDRALTTLCTPACLAALQRGETLAIPERTHNECFIEGGEHMHEYRVNALMLLPMPIATHSPSQLIGLLCIDTPQPHKWNTYEQATLQEVAKYAGAAVSDAHTRGERWRAEKLLLKSEATNRALLNAIPDLMFRLSRRGIFLDYKAPRESQLWLKSSEFLGRNVEEVMPPAVARETQRQIEYALLTGEMQIFEYQLPDQPGGHSEYEARLVPCAEDEVMAIVRDITERKRLEAQLLQIQKIESVGQLAGGIAHDFNNLLTAIIGYADLAMMSLPSNADALSDVEEIHRAAERAAGLTRQLLAFARWQVVELRMIRLNDLIFDLYKLLRRLIGEDIELILLPFEQNIWARVDPGQLEQVLVNLAVNARDAMPEGGKLTITIGQRALDAESARRHVGVAPGEYAMLTISDTGVGMDDYVKSHLFEPFFTTKEKGRGTGLGLATCYGIIKQHGGLIEVESALGDGTTIRILLPRMHAAGDSEHSLADEARGLPRGNEIILLVEDEPAVRVLAARVLRAQGYVVFEAENGDEALSLVRQRGQAALHLLLTDVVMPRMSGKTLAERVTSLLPDLKVLFTSGYTNDTMYYQGAVEAGIAFLQKPFTPAMLARKVREVLDR